ncbi:MAG: hypothetical protein ACF8SC_06485 [Phycisphaerales bacterium JB037]
MKKACLFGGTLVAAGLSGAAGAQQGTFSSPFTYTASSYVYSLRFGSGTDNQPPGQGFFDLGASVAGASASAFARPREMRIEVGDGDEQESASGEIRLTSFGVTADTTASVLWDSLGVNISGSFLITDTATQATIASGTVGPNPSPTGSMDFQLFAGSTYALEMQLQTLNLSSDSAASGFISFVAPAPPSAALLGLGGLLTARRRR